MGVKVVVASAATFFMIRFEEVKSPFVGLTPPAPPDSSCEFSGTIVSGFEKELFHTRCSSFLFLLFVIVHISRA